MTPFSVDWPPDILSDLTDIWLQAPDRQAVTDAQARIDRLLGRNPLGHVRPLSEGLYRLDVYPLVVTYAVDPDRYSVRIESVRAVP
jgi:hypothetical protein